MGGGSFRAASSSARCRTGIFVEPSGSAPRFTARPDYLFAVLDIELSAYFHTAAAIKNGRPTRCRAEKNGGAAREVRQKGDAPARCQPAV